MATAGPAATVLPNFGLEQVFVQPDATGTWAGIPSGLSITIPTWANFLTLGLGTGGGSGGGGRQGASLSARSGGAGGQASVAMLFRIPLRNASGVLLAPSGSLTVGASVAGGAGAAVADTDGSPGVTGPASSFTFNAVLYSVNTAGIAAPGGGAVSVNSGSNSTSMFFVSGALATSITASVGTAFPNGITSAGAPGGSISVADALLTVSGIILIQTGGATLNNLTAGANGSGYQRGSFMAAVGGNGGLSSNVAAAGNGGNGIFGSGGGGGGAALNGRNSGAGGRGGAGWAIFQWGV